MKRLGYPTLLLFRPLALLACCLLLGVVNSTSKAATIEYSWTGTIEPLDPAKDPWAIGAAGKPFTISAFVDEDALDSQNLVDTAIFELTDATLLVDGTLPTFLRGGQVFFGDRTFRDLVAIDLDEVEINGVREKLFAAARLPTSTIAFERVFEFPPTFAPTLTIAGGGTLGDGSSYRTITDGGVVVTGAIIPEPSMFALSLLAFLGTLTVRSRRRRGL